MALPLRRALLRHFPLVFALASFSVPDAFSQVSRFSPIGIRGHAEVKFRKWCTKTSIGRFCDRSNYDIF